MKTIEIKTIDIKAKTWFDKVNGNSYFAALVTLNFGMSDEQEIKIPFSYGYGEQYISESLHVLQCMDILPTVPTIYHLSEYCRENNIILRNSNQKNCLKRDLKNLIA